MTDRSRGAAFFRSPLFWQYLLLAVLFLRTIWGIWDVRDLTSGDTSSYYLTAFEFAHKLVCDIAWSPLYTSYFGAFHWLNPDPYFVAIAHRIGILAMLTVLIFEVSRRLLAPMIAWFITAWWLALPINFNALYEVHLFAVIPILVFWLLLAWRPSLRVRGICVGFLVLTVVLVRNELLIALATFGAASVAFDLWQIWRGEATFRPFRYLATYGVPVLIAIGIIGFTYWRSTDKYPQLAETMKAKHTLNISQIYCFGYSQRHPEYKDSPWTGYQALMIRDFGNPTPTMKEALAANPRAMFEHFWWNAQLIPSGLQVALFNCRSGNVNPDYAGTTQNKPVALALSALYLAVVIAGLVLFARNFRFWWREWLSRRAWVIFGIAAVCSTVVIVMIMQRPRPSYMFAQSLALMWVFGFSLQVVLFHLRLGGAWKKAAIALMVAVTFLIPRYYVEGKPVPPKKAPNPNRPAWKIRPPKQMSSRPLLGMLRLLQPYREALLRKEIKAAAGGYPYELNSYLGLGSEPPDERIINTMPLLVTQSTAQAFSDEIRKQGATILVIPIYQSNKPQIREFMKKASSFGWKLVKTPANPVEQFWLYVADEPESLAKPTPTP